MEVKNERVNFKETKRTVSIEKILGHYGLLKDMGREGDELIGFCPIHDKKHYNKDSFCVDTTRNI